MQGAILDMQLVPATPQNAKPKLPPQPPKRKRASAGAAGAAPAATTSAAAGAANTKAEESSEEEEVWVDSLLYSPDKDSCCNICKEPCTHVPALIAEWFHPYPLDDYAWIVRSDGCFQLAVLT